MPDITVEQVLESRRLAEPIRLLDMCPQSDGAAAIVVASKEFARKRSSKPAKTRFETARLATKYSSLRRKW